MSRKFTNKLSWQTLQIRIAF